MDRRRFLRHGACVGAALAVGRARGDEDQRDPEKKGAELITSSAARAIERGLAFLASRQSEEGFFTSARDSRNVAIVALAGMAFLSGGSTPGRGPYGRHVERCLSYVLAHARESGFIVAPHGDVQRPMYGHGFATLFLAECYGMTARVELREKLGKATNLIKSSQNQEGGWRYEPVRRDADLSVTVCQMMALRAARNAGISVSRDSIDQAVSYVKNCQNADGGFSYMLQPRGPSEFARSAAGVAALYSAGVYRAEAIDKGLDYLGGFLPRAEDYDRRGHFLYGHYYAVQAMWQAGGERWERWFPAIRDVLLTRQSDDGSWKDALNCQEYATSMACIILQIPNNYLPIFQR